MLCHASRYYAQQYFFSHPFHHTDKGKLDQKKYVSKINIQLIIQLSGVFNYLNVYNLGYVFILAADSQVRACEFCFRSIWILKRCLCDKACFFFSGWI